MKLSAPKTGTWMIAVVAGVLGIVLQYRIVHLGVLAPYAFLLVAAAFALLAISTFVRGM